MTTSTLTTINTIRIDSLNSDQLSNLVKGEAMEVYSLNNGLTEVVKYHRQTKTMVVVTFVTSTGTHERRFSKTKGTECGYECSWDSLRAFVEVETIGSLVIKAQVAVQASDALMLRTNKMLKGGQDMNIGFVIDTASDHSLALDMNTALTNMAKSPTAKITVNNSEGASTPNNDMTANDWAIVQLETKLVNTQTELKAVIDYLALTEKYLLEASNNYISDSKMNILQDYLTEAPATVLCRTFAPASDTELRASRAYSRVANCDNPDALAVRLESLRNAVKKHTNALRDNCAAMIAKKESLLAGDINTMKTSDSEMEANSLMMYKAAGYYMQAGDRVALINAESLNQNLDCILHSELDSIAKGLDSADIEYWTTRVNTIQTRQETYLAELRALVAYEHDIFYAKSLSSNLEWSLYDVIENLKVECPDSIKCCGFEPMQGAQTEVLAAFDKLVNCCTKMAFPSFLSALKDSWELITNEYRKFEAEASEQLKIAKEKLEACKSGTDFNSRVRKEVSSTGATKLSASMTILHRQREEKKLASHVAAIALHAGSQLCQTAVNYHYSEAMQDITDMLINGKFASYEESRRAYNTATLTFNTLADKYADLLAVAKIDRTLWAIHSKTTIINHISNLAIKSHEIKHFSLLSDSSPTIDFTDNSVLSLYSGGAKIGIYALTQDERA